MSTLDAIQDVEETRDEFIQHKQDVIKSNPGWDPEHDARITVFSKCINVLNSTQLGLTHIHFHLTDQDWWDQIASGQVPDQDSQQTYVDEFGMFLKVGMVQFLNASIESSFREILSAIDPGVAKDGRGRWKNIYQALLARLGLPQYEPLLDLLRLIRNSLHNNGIYRPPSGKNQEVEWDGEKYEFVDGQAIDFATFELLCEIAQDLGDMLRQVMERNEVQKISGIDDPYSYA